jgi:dynactin complex subunit
LGEHINVIHNSIEKIEQSISQIQSDHRSHIEQSGRELQQIKETMVLKSEVESLLQELNEAVKGTFPSIPLAIPEQTSQ